jgi:hypothetical protein
VVNFGRGLVASRLGAAVAVALEDRGAGSAPCARAAVWPTAAAVVGTDDPASDAVPVHCSQDRFMLGRDGDCGWGVLEAWLNPVDLVAVKERAQARKMRAER